MERMAEIARLAYEEGVRGLSEQKNTLESIRGRAATNIGIVSLAASFLGPAAIDRPLQSALGLFLALSATACFVASVVLSVLVLRSSSGWVFSQSPVQILKDYNQNNPNLKLDEVYGSLARFLEESLNGNEALIVARLRKLNAAFILTTLQVIIAVVIIGLGVGSD